MAQTESQVVALELERVLPRVPTLFDREGVFYAALEKRPVEIVSNRDMRIPLELRPGGIPGHFNPDGGDMGRGNAPTYDKATIHPVYTLHRVEVTTLAQWATDDRRKAVLNSFRRTLATSMAEYRRFVDSLCMTAGNGVLATITTVSTAGGVDTYTCTTDGYGVRLLRYGYNISVFDTTLATNRSAGGESSITTYDLQNKTVAVTPAVTGATAGDKIVADGLTSTPPVSILGVPYHNSNASTGTWMGFDRSVTPEIRANRVNANNAFLTLPLPRLAVNKIGDRVGMDNVGRLQAWMHPAQVQAYEQLGFNVTQINRTGEGRGLDLYFGGAMQMAGTPVKKSFSWDRTRIDFIALDVWGRGVIQEAGFYKPEGTDRYIWEIRGASGGLATSNIFYIAAGFNVFMNNPAGASYIDSLKVPSGY